MTTELIEEEIQLKRTPVPSIPHAWLKVKADVLPDFHIFPYTEYAGVQSIESYPKFTDDEIPYFEIFICITHEDDDVVERTYNYMKDWLGV